MLITSASQEDAITNRALRALAKGNDAQYQNSFFGIEMIEKGMQ